MRPLPHLAAAALVLRESVALFAIHLGEPFLLSALLNPRHSVAMPAVCRP